MISTVLGSPSAYQGEKVMLGEHFEIIIVASYNINSPNARRLSRLRERLNVISRSSYQASRKLRFTFRVREHLSETCLREASCLSAIRFRERPSE